MRAVLNGLDIQGGAVLDGSPVLSEGVFAAHFRGPWLADETYLFNDLVGSHGALHRCAATAATTGTWVAGEWQRVYQPVSSREIAAYQTGTLAAHGREVGSVELGISWRLYRVSTSRPARVRLYGSAAQRDADLTRAAGELPGVNSGLLLDYVTEAGRLDAYLTPLVEGASFEVTASPLAAITVDELAGTSGVLQVLLSYIPGLSPSDTGQSTQGPPGPPGPAGPAGSGATGGAVAPVLYTQDIPSDTWIIDHSFTYYPSVVVFDSTGAQVLVEITHEPGRATIRAAMPFAGRANLS